MITKSNGGELQIMCSGKTLTFWLAGVDVPAFQTAVCFASVAAGFLELIPSLLHCFFGFFGFFGRFLPFSYFYNDVEYS